MKGFLEMFLRFKSGTLWRRRKWVVVGKRWKMGNGKTRVCGGSKFVDDLQFP